MIHAAAYALIGYVCISALVFGMITGCLVIRLLAAYFNYQLKQVISTRYLISKLEGGKRR